jgi:hypothetical protein
MINQEITMEADKRWSNRVDQDDLQANSVRLPRDAGLLTREVGSLASAYFGAIDKGDIEAMLGHLDQHGFRIHVLSPDDILANEEDYRQWFRRIVSTFSGLHHTVVALEPRLISRDSVEAKISVHSEVDLRNPAQGSPHRANVTLDIIWELNRGEDGRWVISSQSENPTPSPMFSTVRARQFAVSYLDNLDRRNLDGMLDVLAPQGELNIALNQGLIIEDFPHWFKMIDETFVNSKHRVQGLVALGNSDGTIDAHLRIHFSADKRNPKQDEEASVDFSVDRIWTIRQDATGKPQLISQRPFVPFDLRTRVDPLDVFGALEAVRRRDNEVVRDWLRSGGDPNAYALDGFNLFLAAAATGNTETLRLLMLEGVGPHKIDPSLALKDPRRPDYHTNILAPHLSAQKGDVASTMLLLAKNSDQLHARIEVNGHTPLLQSAFYGHVELARAIPERLIALLPKGVGVEEEMLRLFSETTLRGINATQFGHQFGNQAMVDALEPFDKTTPEQRLADTVTLLEVIPAGPRNPEAGTPAQNASEAAMDIIVSGLAEVSTLGEMQRKQAATQILGELKKAVNNPNFEPNRLAGALLQTPLIAAVTGTNTNEDVARLRGDIVDILLEKGADPDVEERYPMSVDAVIRAAVFNHFEILKKFEKVMSTEAMRQALNTKPAVNGLTALHDSVLRAATGATGYLDQIRWARGLGARIDIPDHTGRTQRDFAVAAFVTEGQKANAAAVWQALQTGSAPPKPYSVFADRKSVV